MNRRTGTLPPEVRQFIVDRIDSVPALEALIMMCHERRSWTASEIASRTYVAHDKALEILASLQRHGLVAAGEPADSFVFTPASEEDLAMVRTVAQEYRANLIPIARLIHDKAPSAVQEFARAFDLKKDR
jgi:hypothetical protein